MSATARDTSVGDVEENTPLRVLLLEDDPTDRALVEEVLSRSDIGQFQVTWFPRLASALMGLNRQKFDIAVIDITLPDSAGLQTYHRIRAAAPTLPVVVLTGTMDMRGFGDVLRAGAQDCLLKLHPLGELLPRAMHYAIERHRINTELTHRFQELERSEARLHSILNSNTDAVLIVGREGKVRFANESAASMFGSVLDRFIGSDMEIPEAGNGAVVIDVLRPGGGHGTAEMRAIATVWDNEDVTLVALRDITDLLEARARQAEINEQLRHAQRLDSLGTLASGIAHDLNNTLVPIDTIAPMLRRSRNLSDQERRGVELIIASVQRASRLVRQILTFSRQGAQERKPIRLDELTRDVLAMLRAVIPPKIHFDAQIAPVPTVLGNQGQLYQVILNFMTNAAQAIGSNPGTISVGVAPEKGPDGSPHVRLHVADTGCGMDEATQARIFEPFFTTKADREGTGLGLSVVKGIVVEHLGTISVKSKVGAGTRFDVVFPAGGNEGA